MDRQPLTEDQLDALLAERDPIEAAQLRSRALQAPLDALFAETGPRRRKPRRWHRRTRLTVGFGLASVGAAAVSLVGVTVFSSKDALLPGLRLPAAQAAVLDRIASRAAQQAGPRGHQWLYLRYAETMNGVSSVGSVVAHYTSTVTTQQWTNVQDVQRIRTTDASLSFPTVRDRQSFFGPDHSALSSGIPPRGQISDTVDPSPGASPLSPQNLPQGAEAIRRRFQQLFREDPTDYAKAEVRIQLTRQFNLNFFGELAELLEDSTSPQQRAAAVTDLGYVQGVQILGIRRDDLGRVGTAVRFVWPYYAGQVQTLIIDPRTGNLLQMTVSSLRAFRGIPQADGYSRTTYLQRAIVKTDTALPNGRTLPYRGVGAANVTASAR